MSDAGIIEDMAAPGYDFSILIELGLTIRQAQVYLTMVQSGRTTAKTIAKTLQIDRAEVYRALTGLERICIVKRILTKPTIFEAIPISEALTILLNQNAEKQIRIQAEAEQFIQESMRSYPEQTSQEKDRYSVAFLPYTVDGFVNAVNNSQVSIDVIDRWNAGLKSLMHSQIEVFKEAVERGVEFRYIVNIPQGEKIPFVYHTLGKGFSIKRAHKVPEVTLVITDKKEANILTMEKTDREKTLVQILTLKDPSVVAIFEDYFELKWHNSKKVIYTEGALAKLA